ncbi:MAG: MarR family transcriptional regulator [Methanobacteriaceae archaeon]|nr:MarR family transcriptional regulator [Methanobacteriaceae archaeon]
MEENKNIEKPEFEKMVDNLLIYYPLFYRKLKMSLDHENQKSKSAGYYQILGTLKVHGTMSISKIGRILCISKPNMTIFIDNLVKEGHVIRSPHDTDRRITNIDITPEGIQFLIESRKIVEKIIRNNISHLNKDEYNSLNDSLKTIKSLVFKINCE